MILIYQTYDYKRANVVFIGVPEGMALDDALTLLYLFKSGELLGTAPSVINWNAQQRALPDYISPEDVARQYEGKWEMVVSYSSEGILVRAIRLLRAQWRHLDRGKNYGGGDTALGAIDRWLEQGEGMPSDDG